MNWLDRVLPEALRVRGLLVRSTLVVILASLLTGLVAVAFTAIANNQRAHQASKTRLNELLDTVQSTVSVACFAKDSTLAIELAQGLLSNSDVLAVMISTEDQVLADRRRSGLAPLPATLQLQRPVYSPFAREQQVGQITLTPDPQVIEARIREEVWLAAVQLSWQLGMVTLSVVAIMLLFIVRPIKAMSDRLHRMDPTAGERLEIPFRHAGSEIGQLVRDVNALAERLVGALATERSLREQGQISERKYHTIFDNAESGLFLMAGDGDGTLTSWNPAFAQLFGIAPQATATTPATPTLAQLPWLEPQQMRALVQSALQRPSAVTHDLQLQLPEGQISWVNLVLRRVDDNLLQGVVHDVSPLKESEATARQQAITDPLTGLANRLGLQQRLHALVQAQAATQRGGFALLLINLDGFRSINEGLGLPAGDSILQTMTRRLTACVKSDDTLARTAADNFAVILHELTRGDLADQVASRMRHAMRQPCLVDGSPISLYASIGITLFPADGVDVPTLMRQAELALDNAKSAGGDQQVFFNTALTAAAEERRRMESDLRNAIQKQEFVMFYQPIIDLRGQHLSGAEALIRWRHPTRGLVPPDSFIPLAEKLGLICDIGQFALEAVCQQVAAWEQQGLDYLVSLNVSGRQIPDALSPQRLQDTVSRFGVSPSRLALEITESVMLQDVNKSLAWLNAVHALGFRVYLDDFGTGYSSLSYLKRFPVDTIKVDQSFVRDMRAEGNENTLVGAIIAMGRSLGLDIVAEGVELRSQLVALERMGCHYAQGYYFSKPVPAQEFAAVASRVNGLLTDHGG